MGLDEYSSFLGCGIVRWRARCCRWWLAGPYKVKDLQVISGPSPFAGGCPGAVDDETNIAGHELEPMITVNPANPRNIIATWKQDVGPFNGRPQRSRRLLAGRRQDVDAEHDSRSDSAQAGRRTHGSDPWVSAGGDGTVYFGGLAADISTEPPTTAVVASHSRDGGRSWPAPATVAAPLQGNETDAITASPRLAGHAYLVWANFDFRPPEDEHRGVLAHDRRWRYLVAPRPGRPAGPFAIDLAPRILVLPDGTLVAVFARVDFELGLGNI